MTIELHTWNTPHGRKISVALEEMGLPYKVIPVNISKGEQMAPEFLKLSPNNKIPAIVDPDGPDGKPVSIFESGAILLVLERDEMVHLARHRPEAAHLPHQPFVDGDTRGKRFRQEFAGLFAEIEQDRA